MEMLEKFAVNVDADGRIIRVTYGEGEKNPAFQQQLSEYLDRSRRSFDLHFEVQASSFQRAVLEAVQAIPYGETRTYQWVASKVGAGGASQAVGQALTKNPLLLLIPCHRVVPKAGGVGGYAAGSVVKAGLLALETDSTKP